MKTRLVLGVCFGIALVCLAGENRARGIDAKSAGLDQLAWLTGNWSSEKNGKLTEEYWMAPRGHLMLGINRTTGAAKTSFEFMRIEIRNGTPTYLAQPQGAPETPFPLKSLKGTEVIFENPKHDFPQRIIYRLAGKRRLVARIEGTIEGKERFIEWTWDKQDPK